MACLKAVEGNAALFTLCVICFVFVGEILSEDSERADGSQAEQQQQQQQGTHHLRENVSKYSAELMRQLEEWSVLVRVLTKTSGHLRQLCSVFSFTVTLYVQKYIFTHITFFENRVMEFFPIRKMYLLGPRTENEMPLRGDSLRSESNIQTMCQLAPVSWHSAEYTLFQVTGTDLENLFICLGFVAVH